MRGIRVALLGVVLLTGCGDVKIDDYAGTTPEFRPQEYFLGHTQAWGIFQTRDGALKRQFSVDIDGRMDGDELVLVEDFVYRDGEVSQRVWRIRQLDEHRYEGRASDVVGVATGVAHGQALNWRYKLNVDVDGSEWTFDFDDWMFLLEDGVLVNRAEMSKFGVRVGEVTLFFKKETGT